MYFYHKEWTLFCLSSVQVLISMIFFTLAASHWTELKISKCWSNTIFYCFSDGLTDPPDSREHSREQKKSESDLVQTCDICDEDTTTTDLGAKPPSPLPQLDGASKTPGLCSASHSVTHWGGPVDCAMISAKHVSQWRKWRALRLLYILYLSTASAGPGRTGSLRL